MFGLRTFPTASLALGGGGGGDLFKSIFGMEDLLRFPMI